MRSRIGKLALLVWASSCAVSGCGLLLGIEDIEKPADAGRAETGATEAGGSWCEREGDGHLFCEDFDRGEPRFSSSVELGGGNVSTADDIASSPPRSLLAVCPPSGTDPTTAAAPWRSSSMLETVSIAFDVRIEQTTSSSEIVQFVKLLLDESGKITEVGLGLVPGKGGYGFEYKVDESAYSNFVDVFTLRTNAWVRVELSVHTASVGSATVDLDVDGASVVKGAALAHPLKPARVNALVGIAYAPAGHGGWRVRIDNVVIDGS